jgi:hypothetical protein
MIMAQLATWIPCRFDLSLAARSTGAKVMLEGVSQSPDKIQKLLP